MKTYDLVLEVNVYEKKICLESGFFLLFRCTDYKIHRGWESMIKEKMAKYQHWYYLLKIKAGT